MKKSMKAKLGAGSVIAVALSLGVGGIAGAQTDAEETDAEATAGETEENSREGRKSARRMAIAEILDITVEELEEQRQEGLSLAEIAGDQVDEVVDAIVERAEARIADRVEEGRITQDEADERLANFEERVADRVENGRDGERRERRGDRRANRVANAGVETVDS